eukprot:41658_1
MSLIFPQLFAFRPLCCRLHQDSINVYAMSIDFKFQAVQEIDTITIQCSRLLNARDFSSFSTQLHPLQDVEVMRTNAQGINQLIISSLLPGTLYHCRCISQNSAHQYTFTSQILSTSTRNHVSSAPILSSMLKLIKSENDNIIKLKWNPLAQDVNQLIIQISKSIPPKWDHYEINVEGDVAALFEYDIGITKFDDGEAYSTRIMFSNVKGIGYSNVLSIVVPFIYLENIDVRAAANVEMSEMTPTFHRKIYSYSIMVSPNCESIEFGITPINNVRNIIANSIKNRSVNVDKITDKDNQELIDGEYSSDTIDMTINNDNLLKSKEQIDEEIDEMIDENNNDIEQFGDERIGMDNFINAETQSFNLNAPGTATKFIIESGANIKYEILVIRREDTFGIPKYQTFHGQEPEPCPKQKRIIIRYGSFWVYYKEYIVGFLVFVFMIFVRMYERSTRIKVECYKYYMCNCNCYYICDLFMFGSWIIC